MVYFLDSKLHGCHFFLFVGFHSVLIWVVPLPSNSDHQDYFMFSRGFQAKPSFATITGKGDNPSFNTFFIGTFWVFGC